ncbi:MAG: hypothetical protein HXY34_07070 [Candidatus Thorarchaeota archaeon]|nr:hypothetical protein [Candidatus Thorarchaeota archaeon]
MLYQTLVILLFLPVVSAIPTSQGLEWGVRLGSRADYTLSSNWPGLVMNENIYMNVTAMPGAAMPDPVTTWLSIPDPSIDFWWANGTNMGLTALLFIPIYAVGGQFVAPIGNWTLLQILLATALTGETFSSTSSLWQVEYKININATAEYRITLAYSKTDGFFSVYKYETWNTVTSTLVHHIHATRTGMTTTFDIVGFLKDNMLLVGAAVVVIVILGVVCAKRK